MSKRRGYDKKLRQVLLSLDYSHPGDAMRAKILKGIFCGLMTGKSFAWITSDIKRRLRTALVNLRCFTGGTITNSYSESINSLLRKAGLKQRSSIVQSLRFLVDFCDCHYYKPTPPFSANEYVKPILSEVSVNHITNGCLRVFQNDYNLARRTCRVVKCTSDILTVQENKPESNVYGKKMFRNDVWQVNWNGSCPVCNCIVSGCRGIPCKHVIASASYLNREIPDSMFDQRFKVKDGCDVDTTFRESRNPRPPPSNVVGDQ